ncbi:MAG: vitamin 1,25-hydroxylase [Pseudonocardiales bacterium]|uniref:cytochrome P450 family protein n=1 Tax=Pseudonocardia sp. TaxID=60912 RepID=UPI0026373FB7|nr:cytochrome P450 [Pseudonocardia sp.]MCW2721729.1 hydroxylase [Pseudonocardia sp.]MDT7616823.1 vitamin 1,25-hydroxylase [Pseudonocardiales bacterium]MDT7708857.1 vitamin 1,25-hydroxylase [Pseudonocardiales bacterium]
MTATLDLFDGSFWNDPYPAYDAARADEPVRRVDLPDGPVWMMFRHADVRAALTDARLSKDWRWTLPPEQRAEAPDQPLPMMLLMDPPGHTRLRKLVSRSFTLRRMEELRPRVEAFATQLLDELPATGKVDLMADYAFLLPVYVICELLGVPPEDRDDFAAWSNTMVDESTRDQAMEAAGKLHGYLSQLIDAKRENPDDALISALIQEADGGDRLSQAELVAMAMLLLIAGHETTVNLIGNGVLALLTHPEQLALVRERPELMASAVEEFLRWDSPIHSTPVRFAAEDVEYSGVTIPAGAVVILSLAAANRDAGRFDDPEELKVDRDASGHVAFGHGLHHCLGAQLARIEGQEAIGLLLARRPDIALAVDPVDLTYRRSTLIRGLKTLPVTFG